MSASARTILLIDDQPLVAAAMRRLLASAPEFALIHCADPCRAEDEVDKHAAAAVIVDMVIPTRNGLDVVRGLRANARTATIPIVMMSSREEPAVKATALDAGADDYLTKLPDPTELVARLRALLRRASWSSRLDRTG